MVQLSSLIAQEESFPITSPELSKLKLPGSTSILKSDGSGFEEDHPGIQIQPTAGFVLKTKSGDSKVFINVCYCDKIEKPGIKHKLDDDGKEVEGWNVPLSMGPIRKCLDKANNTCSVVDAVIHPSVQDDIHLDTSASHRNFICQILMQCFDQKYKELSPLDRKYSLPNTKYIGYVNVKTGEIVRKMGKDVEICKQYIKDTSSRPKIVEEMSRSQIKDDAAISLNTASETSSMSPATTTYNTSSSGNKIDATTITTTTPTPTPLLLSIDVYLQILDDEGIEKLLSVQEFLDALQNVQQRHHHDHDHDQHHQNCPAEERSIQDVLPTKKWDSSSRIPLILDSYDFEQYFKVSHVVVQASTWCNFCSESIEIYVSAFCLKVMTKSHGKTSTTTECIQECILPFSVNTQQVKCTYNPNTNVLSISMQVSSTSICQKADIGSQPWLIANALSLKTNKKSRRNTTSDNNRNDNQNEEGDNHKTEKVFDDDPFHLQSPFPWKQQSSHNSSTMTANNQKNMTNKNKSTTDSATMTCILPEDRFHKNDCMSQYLIEKQQQQQEQRLQTTKAKEKVFMGQPDNREKQPASSKNLLLKNENDSEYYMDCFKENKDSSSNSTSGTSSNYGVLLDDASFQRHHMNCLKQAEEMLSKKICCPPSASVTEKDDISNTSPIYENWWYKMMY